MNRRSFINSILAIGVAPLVIPSALTYSRVWTPPKKPIGILINHFCSSHGALVIYSKSDLAAIKEKFINNQIKFTILAEYDKPFSLVDVSNTNQKIKLKGFLMGWSSGPFDREVDSKLTEYWHNQPLTKSQRAELKHHGILV